MKWNPTNINYSNPYPPNNSLHSLHGQCNGVQYFILFFNSWRDSAFLIISGRISQSFAPIFETVSLPYLHDLIVLLSERWFFLKSYEWSEFEKFCHYFWWSPLFTLNISVNSTWIFLSWIVTELSFSWCSRKEELVYRHKQVSKHVHATCLFDY